MKTLKKISLQSIESNNEETPKKPRAGKLLMPVLVIFMLSWITLLSSCAVFVGTPRHEGHAVIVGHHDERHGNNEHHD
jgi:hypothetical protein